MPNLPSDVQTLVSVMKSMGLHNPTLQKALIKKCQHEGVGAITMATVQYLLDTGLSASCIPAPTRPVSGELRERAYLAINEVVEEYHSAGGVLVARGYWTQRELAAMILERWFTKKPPLIAKTEGLPEHIKAERVARTSIAAQACVAVLRKHGCGGNRHGDPDGLFIPETALEAVCVEAAKAMEQAYRAPDEWVAAKLGNKED
jgi:hypothetical protein